MYFYIINQKLKIFYIISLCYNSLISSINKLIKVKISLKLKI